MICLFCLFVTGQTMNKAKVLRALLSFTGITERAVSKCPTGRVSAVAKRSEHSVSE